MGDFNIDILMASAEPDKLEEFCCLFGLNNLIKQEICFTKNYELLIDWILTNMPLSNTPKHLKLV